MDACRIRTALTEMTRIMRGAGSVESFVLAEGVSFDGARTAERPGVPKQCFRNAMMLAVEKGWNYAEGFAMEGRLLANGVELAMDHAWCVDDEGNAVDPTWPAAESSLYLGVVMPARTAWDRVRETGAFGVLRSGSACRPDHEFMARLAARESGPRP